MYMASNKLFFIAGLILLLSIADRSLAQSPLRTQLQKNEFFEKLQKSYLAHTDIKTAELASQARHHYPESVVTWYISARMAMKVEDYMTAYEYLSTANSISDDITIDYMLLDVYTQLGEFDALVGTYEELLQANPYNTGLIKRYLNFLHDSQKYEKFDSELRKALNTAHASRNILYHEIYKLNKLIAKRMLKSPKINY